MAAMTSFQADKCCHLVSKTKRLLRPYAAAYASSWSITHSNLFQFCPEFYFSCANMLAR